MGQNSDRPAQAFLTRAKTQSPESAHHAVTGIDRNGRSRRVAGPSAKSGGQPPRRLIALAFVLAGANTAIADDMKMPINSGDLKWGPAPPTLPKGAEITVLSGDPSKDGPFVLRLKMPGGYRVPAHNHPTTESLTVASGNFHIGMGDKLDETKAIELTAGGFGEAPAKMNHYGWASTPSVVQIQGQGPFAITYVNPADDPSKQ
jgi:hypothetical protein